MLSLSVVLTTAFVPAVAAGKAKAKAKPIAPMNEYVTNLMSRMTLQEKIGQLNLMVAGDITTGGAMDTQVGGDIANGNMGGVFNIKGFDKIKALQEIAVTKSRLGIPLLVGMDVIHGYETMFPIPLALSCSWNLDAIKQSAAVAAKEASADGINWTYSPMVDVALDARWGRVSEGSGEDPYLGARIAEAMVQGYQGTNYSNKDNIMACLKHFALYGAVESGLEYNTTDMSRLRMYNQYFAPYEAAVKAGVGSVMSSFNLVDSTLYRYSPYEDQKELRVPHSLNSIRFSFVMPEYRDENAVSYECWLDGQDPTWSMPRYATFKEYSHLDKGHYVFHVRATDNISKQTTETTFSFEVLPAWYETIWAYLIYITIIMGLLWLMVQWLKRRAEVELRKLKEGKERQLKEQRERFRREQEEKEHELTKLRAEQLETELKHKSGELADSTINLVRKNDILRTLDEKMQTLSDSIMQNDSKAVQKQAISRIRHEIKRNMEDDDNWERFQENFNIVYDNYLGTLVSMFPTLKKNDLKLCAYLKMGLSSKEIASLLNTNLRSVETARYRLRKKLGLEGGANLTGFLQAVNRDADVDADTNTNADAEVDADPDAKQ